MGCKRYIRCVKNRLTVNTAKSKVMYFSKKVIKSHDIMMNLLNMSNLKYIGLNANSKCSFAESLDKFCSKARKAQTAFDLHNYYNEAFHNVG